MNVELELKYQLFIFIIIYIFHYVRFVEINKLTGAVNKFTIRYITLDVRRCNIGWKL